jgi:hypothetical protein
MATFLVPSLCSSFDHHVVASAYFCSKLCVTVITIVLVTELEVQVHRQSDTQVLVIENSGRRDKEISRFLI